MKINVQLMVNAEHKLEDIVEIDDYKLEELTEEELEAAIEVCIRNWADQKISIAWEVRDESSGDDLES